MKDIVECPYCGARFTEDWQHSCAGIRKALDDGEVTLLTIESGEVYKRLTIQKNGDDQTEKTSKGDDTQQQA